MMYALFAMFITVSGELLALPPVVLPTEEACDFVAEAVIAAPSDYIKDDRAIAASTVVCVAINGSGEISA